MDQVGVGVIGVGLMGSLFSTLASQLANSRLIGVADIDENRATQLGRSLGVPAFTDYNDLLAFPEVEAVVVATPEDLHVQPALAAAQAGKHLMIEKPLATNREDGLQIIDACRAARVMLMVGHTLRFDPSYGEAFKLVRGGKLGDVVSVSSRRCGSLQDAKRLAGRTTVTFYLGVHEIDVIQWIVGSPIVEVNATSMRKVLEQQDVDDAVMSLLRFENGAIGTLENSWIWPPGRGARAASRSLLVVGTEGIIKSDPYSERLHLYRSEHADAKLPLEKVFFDQTIFGGIGGVYRDEFAHFIECLMTKTAPIVTPEQALTAVLVCCAIEQSLREGGPVHIGQHDVFT